MIVNKAQLSRTLSRQAPRALARDFEITVRRTVQAAQALMISKFESHPVTQEIAGGVGATNISNTLIGAGTLANLFSFIGFERGDNPLLAIRSYLAQNLEVRKISGGSRRAVSIDFAVQVPSLDDVYRLSPVPWAPGLSWAEGIEKGIPGLGQYLTDPGKGRSGGAIQVKTMFSAAAFKSVPYLSKILQEFVNDVIAGLNK